MMKSTRIKAFPCLNPTSSPIWSPCTMPPQSDVCFSNLHPSRECKCKVSRHGQIHFPDQQNRMLLQLKISPCLNNLPDGKNNPSYIPLPFRNPSWFSPMLLSTICFTLASSIPFSNLKALLSNVIPQYLPFLFHIGTIPSLRHSVGISIYSCETHIKQPITWFSLVCLLSQFPLIVHPLLQPSKFS